MVPLHLQAQKRDRRRFVRTPKQQRNHHKEVVNLLKDWLLSEEHMNNPYPTEAEKEELMRVTGLSRKQLCNWFVNARKRVLQPKLAESCTEKKRKSQSTNANQGPPAKKPKTAYKKAAPVQRKLSAPSNVEVTTSYQIIHTPPPPASLSGQHEPPQQSLNAFQYAADHDNQSVSTDTDDDASQDDDTDSSGSRHSDSDCDDVCSNNHPRLWNFATPFGNTLQQNAKPTAHNSYQNTSVTLDEPAEKCGYMVKLYSTLFSASEMKYFLRNKYTQDPGLPACPGLS
jgi:hypothetical protein